MPDYLLFAIFAWVVNVPLQCWFAWESLKEFR
jgi:hypothetical protein